jgi:hypothetical protein
VVPGGDEVLVREVMTPAELLEAMELEEVLHARVADVVASLEAFRSAARSRHRIFDH